MPSMTPMEESGPLSQIEVSYGSLEIHSDDLYKLLRKDCLADKLPASFQHVHIATPAPVKLSPVELHQQVPKHGELEMFFHQRSQICKVLLLWPE